jgi:hypothetical protein
MTRLRRLASAFWLALALVVGQQASALHDLGHATERLASSKDSTSAPHACGQCFVCSGLSSGAAPSLPAFHAPQASSAAPAQVDPQCASTPARLAFRSRAPPTLL